MLPTPAIIILAVVATLGHGMAFFWYVALWKSWKICDRTIFDLPVTDQQLRRELGNSIHTPMHALILLGFLYFGFFQSTTVASFFYSVLATTFWAEIWHYGSHRAFHHRKLHWIHVKHHKSQINTPFTAVSFSFTEKLIFDFGILIPLAALDHFVRLSFYGIAAWFIGYLVINSFSHANFELKSRDYTRRIGKILTSTTYHSLHHARYTGNYGLGTRILDRIFKTEWTDYEQVYERISTERRPMTKLREKVEPTIPA